MSAKDKAIVARWRARLAIRTALLKRARKQHEWEHSPETLNKLTLRKQQVAIAERVIRRHTGVTGMSQSGLNLVAEFEGGQSRDGLFRPYRDPVGVWTIGYGETRGVGPTTKPWTKAKAQERLRVRINRDYLDPVLRLTAALGLDLSQNEADALGSFAYNLGPGVFAAGRTMGDALRSGNRYRVAAAFLVYDKAGGRTLPGLTRRRKAERALFLRNP